MKSGPVRSEINFKAPRRWTQPNRKQRNSVIAMLSLHLSLSISPSSFNLFVRRAAAHFWSTVVCLCQMPKRLQNEEGHMKRGRWLWLWCVTTHTHTHCTLSLLDLADGPYQWTLSITVSFINPVSFTHDCLFRNMDRIKRRNMVARTKFNWNCTELGERESRRLTITSVGQDRWGSQLPLLLICVCVCLCLGW